MTPTLTRPLTPAVCWLVLKLINALTHAHPTHTKMFTCMQMQAVGRKHEVSWVLWTSATAL